MATKGFTDRLAAIDRKLLDVTQAAYLRILDATGIYVATVIFTLATIAVTLRWQTPGSLVPNPMTLFLLAIVAVGVSHLYLMQHKGLYERYNAFARFWETTWLRKVNAAMAVGLVLMDAATLNLVWVCATSLAMYAVAYGLTVKIRGREPKRKNAEPGRRATALG